MGGSGERDCRFFDHLALSPDGECIYYVPCKLADKTPRHALYRLKWTDKVLGAPFLGKEGQAGPADDQFNDPQGVATDDKGNLYVCDRGNNRVLIFSAAGKLLGKFAASLPEQITVHPASGEIYLLCRGRDEKRPDRWSDKASLLKFSAWRAA
jgi:sugar lactone lactonase YvrE